MKKNDYILNYMKNICTYRELGKILSCSQCPPYLIIKGEPLSFYEYGQYGRRISCDVDILADRKDIPYFERELERAGFRKKKMSRASEIISLKYSHQTPPYSKVINNIQCCVDLNFDLFWGMYRGKRFSIKEFIEANKRKMIIYGIEIYTLPELVMLVVLILHDFKDMTSIFRLTRNNCINKERFLEIFHLFNICKTEIKSGEFKKLCNSLYVTPYVFYILYYTQMVVDDPFLEKIVCDLKTEEGIGLLGRYGFVENNVKKWKYDFRTILESDRIYSLIMDDLTEQEKKHIKIQEDVFE